jgi:hypothetical protein
MANALTSWEDHLTVLLQLSEATAGLSWVKADVIAHMVNTFGETSIAKIAIDIGEPASTVSAYTRVSRAFPQEQRNPSVSFSHHLQASFSDSYDEVKKEFVGEERFDWVNKAEDEKLSTRRLRNEIKDHKTESSPEWVEKRTCDHCHLEMDNIEKYVLFQPEKRGVSKSFMLDPMCYTEILDYIEAR